MAGEHASGVQTLGTRVMNEQVVISVNEAQVIDENADHQHLPTAKAVKQYVDAIDDKAVHKTGNESVFGVKNFASSPVIPTQADSDNSTNAVNSSWVVRRIAAWWNSIRASVQSVTGIWTFTKAIVAQGGVTGNATTATTLKTLRNFRVGDKAGSHYGQPVQFNGGAACDLRLPETIQADVIGHATQDLNTEGGTMTGAITSTAQVAMKSGSANGLIAILGGVDDNDANLKLYGKSASPRPGQFVMTARTTSSDAKSLVGSPTGALTWNGANVARSVNGKSANAEGNVTLASSDVGALPSTTTHTSGDVPVTRKVNGKPLSSDVTLNYSDVGALPSTTTHTSGDLPLSGGVITGTLTVNGAVAANSSLSVNGTVSAVSASFEKGDIGSGEDYDALNLKGKDGGAYLNLYTRASGGAFSLTAGNGSTTRSLLGYRDGVLTWDGKNVVRSVNGSNADANGNVSVDVSMPSFTGFQVQSPEDGAWVAIPDGKWCMVSVQASFNGTSCITIRKRSAPGVTYDVAGERPAGSTYHHASGIYSVMLPPLAGYDIRFQGETMRRLMVFG